jgi:hypothetical protein
MATVEQRTLALERAKEVKLATAQLRASIRAGGRTIGATRAARAVRDGQSPMTFYRLLTAVPRIGHTRANTMLDVARINPEARVNADRIGPRRRALLVGELLRFANGPK